MYAAHSRVVSAPRFTEVDMEVIAMQLQQSFKEVENVFVYGGVGGSSATVLMVTSDETIVEDFVRFSRKCLSEPSLNTKPSPEEVRFAAFEQTCPGFASWLKEAHVNYPAGAFFDILICPSDWQKRIKELEVNYFHPSPDYLQRVVDREPIFVT